MFGVYYRWREGGRACLLLFLVKPCGLRCCIFHLIKQTKSKLTLKKKNPSSGFTNWSQDTY